ncbi:MAG: family 1 glycosylhydrolase, partial [Oscillospiraceae bacterium]|nr:family 1 glycosylhydrolase [Oscillospiraceae bacterium]
GPRFMYERYKLPIYITENGMAAHDAVSLDGKVHDPNRIDFLHRYLREFKKASDDGIDCRGYFQWSLMDNFEWAIGYTARFGMIYTDYGTGKRIVKDSALWYKEVIESNGKNL